MRMGRFARTNSKMDRKPNGSSPKQQTPSIQSLDRGLTILEAVAKSSNPVSLGELTGLMEIDRSSVFRLAGTLKRRGFLAYPAGRKDYILGPSLWRLAHKYDWGNMLIKVSHEELKLLASETNETAQLAVREGKQAIFIDSAAANQVISVSGRIGELTPLHCTAHGKALMADLTMAELEAVFGNEPLPPHTKRTVDIRQAIGQNMRGNQDARLFDRRRGIHGRSPLRCRSHSCRRRSDHRCDRGVGAVDAFSCRTLSHLRRAGPESGGQISAMLTNQTPDD